MKFFLLTESGRAYPLPERCKILGIFDSHGHKFVLHHSHDYLYRGGKKNRISHFATGGMVFGTNCRSINTAKKELRAFLSERGDGALDKAVKDCPILNVDVEAEG